VEARTIAKRGGRPKNSIPARTRHPTPNRLLTPCLGNSYRVDRSITIDPAFHRNDSLMSSLATFPGRFRSARAGSIAPNRLGTLMRYGAGRSFIANTPPSPKIQLLLEMSSRNLFESRRFIDSATNLSRLHNITHQRDHALITQYIARQSITIIFQAFPAPCAP
jgi:hypothetical protein